MPLTKSDLDEMMKKQKQERLSEMQTLKELLMEGVREEIKSQLAEAREELNEKVVEVREEFQGKVMVLEQKQTELSDVQSVIDCKVDKLEEEIKTLREMSKNKTIPTDDRSIEPNDAVGDTTENSEDITQLVNYGQRVIGLKPIEQRDILRLKRTMNIDDDEEAKRSCIKEFMRCELRMPTQTVDELLENTVKVWNPTEADWDRLYVEFKDEKSVRLVFTYCKFLKNKDSQILQFFPQEFREQFRTLDAIAYKLRKPESSLEVKYKTRIRYGKQGLKLEKRNPALRNWVKVRVPQLPPVDLDPVPLATASNSPPNERSRVSKRSRSSPQVSPNSDRPNKNSKVQSEKDNHEKSVNFETAEENFVFRNLVDKFACN